MGINAVISMLKKGMNPYNSAPGSFSEADSSSTSTPSLSRQPLDSVETLFPDDVRVAEHPHAQPSYTPTCAPQSRSASNRNAIVQTSSTQPGYVATTAKLAEHFCRVNGCDMFFTNKKDCARHRGTHSPIKQNYQCPNFKECKKSYTRFDALQRHVASDTRAKTCGLFSPVESECLKTPAVVQELDPYDPTTYELPLAPKRTKQTKRTKRTAKTT